MVTRLPVWRRYRGRIAAVVAGAAAIITARHGAPAQPWRGTGHPGSSHSRDPVLCHRRRRASSSRFRENFDKPCPRSSDGKDQPGWLQARGRDGHFSAAVSARRCCRPEPPLGAVMPALARRLPVAIGAISSEAIPVRFTTGLTAGPRTRLRVRLTAVRMAGLRAGLRAGVAAMTSRS